MPPNASPRPTRWSNGWAPPSATARFTADPVASPAVVLEPLPGPPDLEDDYAVGGTLATASQAKLYFGEHLATRQPVIVIIPDASLDPDARGGMRVAASRKLDFGVYAFLDWRSSGGDDVFVISKPDGCSLMAILRKFGPARFADALPLLSHLARCFDASQAWTTFGIRVDPGDIHVRTRDGSADLERFRAWSDLDPQATRCLPFFASGADHSTSSEATLSTSAQEFPPLAQFAALVYRVLAGSAVRYAAFFTSSGYVMASGLSEDGNALLAETICAPETQPSACRFVQLLASLESLPVAELTPLVDPPSTQDIESGKLVPTRRRSRAPRSAKRRPAARSPSLSQPAPPDNSVSVIEKVAELERQLALVRLAAEKEAREEAAKRAREEAAAQQRAEEQARQNALAKQAAEQEARRKDDEAKRQAAEQAARLAAETKLAAEEARRQQEAAAARKRRPNASRKKPNARTRRPNAPPPKKPNAARPRPNACTTKPTARTRRPNAPPPKKPNAARTRPNACRTKPNARTRRPNASPPKRPNAAKPKPGNSHAANRRRPNASPPNSRNKHAANRRRPNASRPKKKHAKKPMAGQRAPAPTGTPRARGHPRRRPRPSQTGRHRRRPPRPRGLRPRLCHRRAGENPRCQATTTSGRTRKKNRSQDAEAKRLADEKRAAEDQRTAEEKRAAAEKARLAKLAEEQRLKDTGGGTTQARRAGEIPAGHHLVGPSRPPPPKTAPPAPASASMETTGQGRTLDFQQASKGFQALRGSTWKVTLLGTLFEARDQPLASITLALPASRDIKDLNLKLPCRARGNPGRQPP